MLKGHLFIIYLLLAVLSGYVFFFGPNKETPALENVTEKRTGGKAYLTATSGTTPAAKIFDIPEDLNFAGEAIPLDQPDVLERFEREIYVNAYWHSNTILMMKRAGKFLPTIERILKENGIPDDFKYLAMIESGLTNAVSPAGATGFWQLMEGTAKERGLEVTREVDERYHFEKSTQAACEFLQNAYARFGNWSSVAASYNMGIAGLTRSKNAQKMPDVYNLLLNSETSRYIFRILAVKQIFEDPRTYGFELQADDLYALPLMRELVVTNSIENLADWALRHNSNYKELKLYNPWLRSTKLTIRNGKSYIIELPA